MSAPTQDEITAAVQVDWIEAMDLDETFWEAAGHTTAALWQRDDLRPSEQGVLDAVMEAEAAVFHHKVAELLVESSSNVALRVADAMPNLPRRPATPEADEAA